MAKMSIVWRSLDYKIIAYIVSGRLASSLFTSKQTPVLLAYLYHICLLRVVTRRITWYLNVHMIITNELCILSTCASGHVNNKFSYQPIHDRGTVFVPTCGKIAMFRKLQPAKNGNFLFFASSL